MVETRSALAVTKASANQNLFTFTVLGVKLKDIDQLNFEKFCLQEQDDKNKKSSLCLLS